MNLETFRRRHVIPVATLVLMLGGAAAHGQRPQGGGGGGGGAMIVDFTAVTSDGKPAAELNPADITIKIGGKPRTVTALTLKKVEVSAPSTAPAAAAAAPTAASAPFSTNDPATVAAPPPAAGSRSFLIVVDTESLRAGTEPAIKTAIEGLLKGLTPADRVAFATAPNDTARVGFGSSLTSVRDAVAAFAGQRPANIEDADTLCRTHNTLTMLRSSLSPLAGREDPTAVIFVASTMSTPGKDTGKNKDKNCEVIPDEYSSLSGAVGLGRVNFYVVQGDPGAMGRDSGLENLAGVTGAGAVMRVVGDGFGPRVLADASAYWVATIAPDPSDRPGQSQRLELKAVREGVTVHARPEAALSRPAGPAPAAKAGSSPKEMIASQAAFTDLQLRALAYSFRGPQEKMQVLVFAEPADATVKIKEMSVGYFDQTGKGASFTPPQIATYPVTTPLQLGVGQYRIRVAATDTTGKSGAVDVTVNTALTTAGPLKLGGMLLGAMTDKGLSPRLTFGPDDKLGAVLEMYGQITGGIEVHFEVAATDTGPALEGLNAIKAAGGPTNEADKFNISAEIPTAKLAPGDYVVRAHVKMAGEPEGRVIRTFRKIAK